MMVTRGRYLSEGYALFLRGEDDLSALEERIAFTFEAKNSSLRSDINSLAAANDELSKEHRSLTEGLTPLQQAKSNNDDFKSDQVASAAFLHSFLHALPPPPPVF